ncbi:hypothetical protein RB195_019899 [Necator americanus]
MTFDITMIVTSSTTWISGLALLLLICSRKKKPRSLSEKKIRQRKRSKTRAKLLKKDAKRNRVKKSKVIREIFFPSRGFTGIRQLELDADRMPITSSRWPETLAKTPESGSLEVKTSSKVESPENYTQSKEEPRWSRRHKFRKKEGKKILPDSPETAIEKSYSFRSIRNIQKTQGDSSSREREKMKNKKETNTLEYQPTYENDETINDAPSLRRFEAMPDTEIGSLHPEFTERRKHPETTSAESILGPEEEEPNEPQQGDVDTNELVKRATLMIPMKLVKKKISAEKIVDEERKVVRAKHRMNVGVQPLQNKMGDMKNLKKLKRQVNKRSNISMERHPFTFHKPVISEGVLTTQSSIATSIDPPTPWFPAWEDLQAKHRKKLSSEPVMESTQIVDPKGCGSLEGSICSTEQGVFLKEDPTMKSVRELHGSHRKEPKDH